MRSSSNISRRYWLATLPLLALGVAGHPAAVGGAMALTALHAVHLAARGAWFLDLCVQVRLAYFALLVVGLLPGMAWVHWLQLAGTAAVVASGYCLLARAMSLLPWNRQQPLTARLVRQALFGLRLRPANACGELAPPNP